MWAPGSFWSGRSLRSVGNVITALATYLFGVLWRTEIGWAIDAVVEGWNLLGFLWGEGLRGRFAGEF